MNQPTDKPEQSSDSSSDPRGTALGDPPVVIHDGILYSPYYEAKRMLEHRWGS